jgi:uracil-DNA glycosylase
VDARAQLHAFLEQRIEAGETELVFDGMTAAQALAALRAAATGPAARELAAGPSDWRAALRAAGAAAPPAAPTAAPPGAPAVASRTAPPPAATAVPAARMPAEPPAWVPPPKPGVVEPVLQHARPGLSVGSGGSELFGGALGDVSSLEDVAALVAVCTRCPLYETALNPVPGTGDPRAGLMVVGEAPGATEDKEGKPFVGAAGQLLTKILSAIHLSRDDVFITNVLKHRPPLNRNPLPDEVQACSPYLLRQLELVRPKAILALGTFASQTLLQTDQRIGQLRGLVHRFYGIPLVVTYHPAALLRNPSWKRPTWEDVQLVRRILDSTAAVGA